MQTYNTTGLQKDNLELGKKRKWMLEKLVNQFSPDVYVTEVTRRSKSSNAILFMFRDSYVSFPTKMGTFTPSSVNGFNELSLKELFVEYAVSHINLVNRMLGLKIVGDVGFEVPLGALLGYSELYVEMLERLANNGVKVTFFVLLHDSDDLTNATDSFRIIVEQLVTHGAEFVLDNIQDAQDLDMASDFFDVVSEFRLSNKSAKHNCSFDELVEKASEMNITALIDNHDDS